MRSMIEDLSYANYDVRQIFAELRFSPVVHILLDDFVTRATLKPDRSSGSSSPRRYGRVIVSPVPSVTAPADRAMAASIFFILIMGSP